MTARTYRDGTTHCPDCDAQLTPLFNSLYCTPCSDQRLATHTQDAFDVDWLADLRTNPSVAHRCPQCGSGNTAPFYGTDWHCWPCGEVFDPGGDP